MRALSLVAAFLSIAPQLLLADAENPCGLPKTPQANELCHNLTRFLPHHAEDFDLTQVEGRYAMDCVSAGGMFISGLSDPSGADLTIDEAPATNVHRTKATFGPYDGPLNFIAAFTYFDPHSDEGVSMTINGDQNGFYITTGWENPRRLSQCNE